MFSSNAKSIPHWSKIILPPVPPASEVKTHELESEIRQHWLPSQHRAIKDAQGEKIWGGREELIPEKFVQYWNNQTEAEAAWKILHLAEENFDRPQLRMFYPNDPLLIYTTWSSDSLEDVEYVIMLEEEYGCKIPDEICEKFFLDYTILEAVQYLLANRNTHPRKNLLNFWRKKA